MDGTGLPRRAGPVSLHSEDSVSEPSLLSGLGLSGIMNQACGQPMGSTHKGDWRTSLAHCVSPSPSQLSGDDGSPGSFVSVDHGSALMGSLACELLVAVISRPSSEMY